MLANAAIVRSKAQTPDHTSVAAAARWDEAETIFGLVDSRITMLRNELSRKDIDVAPPRGAGLYDSEENS